MAITTGAKNTIETPVAEVNKENTKPRHPTKIIENRIYLIPPLLILGKIDFKLCM